MIKYQHYQITKNYSTIYFFLKDNDFSENFITNLRKQMGYIKVNGNDVTINHSLSIGDDLAINSNPNNKTTIMQCILPLDIVYEDDNYLLINKPAGLACMPSKSHYSFNLAGGICFYMKDKDPNFTLRIINRLDKDTSGIVIVAKDSISQKEIKDINKTYYAICEGIVEKDLVIDKKIKTTSKDKINNQKREIANDGKDAKTFVHPIKICEIKEENQIKKFTLIKVNLIHGRTHQIRVHLSSIRHSLLGDEIYGNKSQLIDHTALICKDVSFYHPFKQETLTFSLPFPKDFEKLIGN